MSETIWASVKTDWHSDALCKGLSDDELFFPSEETVTRLNRVRSLFCDLCPVRAKCLNSALINGGPGFWGGTSTSMRNAMLRTRHRAKCPACKNNHLIKVAENEDQDVLVLYQICIACGASWRSDHPVRAES